jgi:stage II sporulation protein M
MKRLKRLYREEWTWFRTRYLKIFLVLFLLFTLAAVVSHLYLMNHPELAEEKLMDLAQRLLEKIPLDKGKLVLYAAITLNNLVAAGLALTTGFIPFLFIPAFAVLLNGAAMGVLSSVLTHKGANLGSVLLFGLAPHGVFEIPAFLYACSLGMGLMLWLSRFIARELTSASRDSENSMPAAAGSRPETGELSFPALLRSTLRTFLLVIIPLLILAALIESLITPWLIKTFIGELSLL